MNQLIIYSLLLTALNSIGYETKEGECEFRPGPKMEDWNPYEMLPALTNKKNQELLYHE